MPHEITYHVHPTDCDMLGHVNHATMITLLERARWELLEPHLSAKEFLARDAWSVVRHVDISYHQPAEPGDDLVVRSGLLSVGRTSYVVRQEVAKAGAPGLVAEAVITFVAIGRDGRPVPVPEQWRALFPHWPGATADAGAGSHR